MRIHDWVPIRWPSDPAWNQSESLRVLDGSPFNCLVLSADTSKAVSEAAQKRGLIVVDSPAETEPAQAVRRESAPIALKGCLWPSVRTGRSGGADAGPTGYPWVDSNGWMSQLAHAQAPGSVVWTTGKPRVNAGPVRPEMYAVAVADAAAYGSRWLVTLDAVTQGGLLRNEAPAREAWSTLTRAVSFFRDYQQGPDDPYARLGVMSGFTGDSKALGQEVLNLCSRRQLPFRILRPGASGKDLKAVLYIEDKPPEASAVEMATSGGAMLIVPSTAAAIAAGKAQTGTHETGYKLYRSGKGSIALGPSAWTDPYLVAQDAHRLLGRAHDAIRLWNAGSSMTYPVRTPGGALVHVINYSGRPVGHPMTLYIASKYKSARFTDLFGRSEALKAEPKGEGVEVSLPEFTSYSSIAFGEKA